MVLAVLNHSTLGVERIYVGMGAHDKASSGSRVKSADVWSPAHLPASAKAGRADNVISVTVTGAWVPHKDHELGCPKAWKPVLRPAPNGWSTHHLGGSEIGVNQVLLEPYPVKPDQRKRLTLLH
jgi:hypothetical protein